jgi:hypothetical protein
LLGALLNVKAHFFIQIIEDAAAAEDTRDPGHGNS